jgi:hypothetical protein
MTHNEPITIQIVLFDLHRLKENRNLKYAAKVQPFIQITKFWKIILKVLYTQMPQGYKSAEVVWTSALCVRVELDSHADEGTGA